MDAAGLDLRASSGGTRLRLRVRPGAQRAVVLGVHDGALRVSVTAPADRGKANRAVLDLIADTLDVAASRVELIAGRLSRDKTVLVPLSPAVVLRRLTEL